MHKAVVVGAGREDPVAGAFEHQCHECATHIVISSCMWRPLLSLPRALRVDVQTAAGLADRGALAQVGQHTLLWKCWIEPLVPERTSFEEAPRLCGPSLLSSIKRSLEANADSGKTLWPRPEKSTWSCTVHHQSGARWPLDYS